MEEPTMIGFAKTTMLLAAMAFSWATIPASAAESYPWEGEWALAVANCSEPNDNNVNYTASRVEGWEHRCEITNLQALSTPSSWLLELDCVGEGEQWRAREILMLDNEAALHIFQDKRMAQYIRCAK